MQIEEYLRKTDGRKGQQCSVYMSHPCLIGGGVYYGIFEKTQINNDSYSMLLKVDDGNMQSIGLPVERISFIRWK